MQASAGGRIAERVETRGVASHGEVERPLADRPHGKRASGRARRVARSPLHRRARGRPAPERRSQRLVRQRGRDRLDRVGHDPAVAQAALRVGVVRLQGGLLLLADGAHRCAREHEWPDRLELGIVQQHDLVEAARDLDHDLERPRRIAEHERLHGGGDVRDPPRLHEVAEVDQPARHQPPRAVGLAHEVVVRHVGVHDLLRQRVGQRLQQRARGRAHALGLRAVRGVRHPVRERVHDLAREPQIPLDRARACSGARSPRARRRPRRRCARPPAAPPPSGRARCPAARPRRRSRAARRTSRPRAPAARSGCRPARREPAPGTSKLRPHSAMCSMAAFCASSAARSQPGFAILST